MGNSTLTIQFKAFFIINNVNI